MKLAIMQPYFFPYIGYFQLIDSADVFAVYDDVNYIKKGWINRNNILVNGKAHLLGIPLQDASQNKLINEIHIDASSAWKNNLLKTIDLNYKKAPFFAAVFPMLKQIIENPEQNLSDFVTYSIQQICGYLRIETKIILSSELEKNNTLRAQDKIIEICKATGATSYHNAIGGIELYERKAFENENITLRFIKTNAVAYQQFKNEFIPWLSIIDVMMFNSTPAIRELLNQKEFI